MSLWICHDSKHPNSIRLIYEALCWKWLPGWSRQHVMWVTQRPACYQEPLGYTWSSLMLWKCGQAERRRSNVTLLEMQLAFHGFCCHRINRSRVLFTLLLTPRRLHVAVEQVHTLSFPDAERTICTCHEHFSPWHTEAQNGTLPLTFLQEAQIHLSLPLTLGSPWATAP